VLQGLDPSAYDVALAVNEDLVNRILGLGYRRGYYPEIDVPGSKALKVLQAPEFRFTGGGSGSYGRLHVKVRHEADGLAEGMVMIRGGHVDFEMDLIAHLIHAASGSISVAVDGIDVSSASVYTGPLIPGSRRATVGGITRALAKADRNLKKRPKVIVDALPIPTQISGIPIRVQDFRADPAGYLVLYLDYDLQR
jgi:hypothetical protein